MKTKSNWKKRSTIFVVLCFCLSIALITGGCAGNTSQSSGAAQTENTRDTSITDSLGNTVTLPENARVVSLYGSFAECWMLSGGSLVGVTQDVLDDRSFSLSDDVEAVGTVEAPSLEKIVALNPDYVILTASLSSHLDLASSLDNMGISYGYFTIDTFDDYDQVMTQFCRVNDRADLYQQNVADIRSHIEAIKSQIPADSTPSVLLLRAYSSGVKAKGTDTIAGAILSEFHCNNVVDNHPSLLEDLSVEEVITEDPDYIFVLTMGDESKALAFMENNMLSNPAWSQLKAVRNEHYVVLPKNLFHYKPNNKWDQSYEYIAHILYPDIFE